MAVKARDVVHVLYWDNFNGHYAEEYKLTKIAADHIELQHLATYQHQQKRLGHGQFELRPLKYLEYFNVPLEDRIRQHKESIEWLCKALSR